MDISVVIIDDNREYAETLSERLKIRGMKARVPYKNIGDINELSDKQPNVIIIDAGFQDGKGLEMMKLWKHELPNSPCIMLCEIGYGHEGKEAVKNGAHSYLMKPFQVDELVDRITEATGTTSA
jgi:DNA-binding response OmpR family regulator